MYWTRKCDLIIIRGRKWKRNKIVWIFFSCLHFSPGKKRHHLCVHLEFSRIEDIDLIGNFHFKWCFLKYRLNFYVFWNKSSVVDRFSWYFCYLYYYQTKIETIRKILQSGRLENEERCEDLKITVRGLKIEAYMIGKLGIFSNPRTFIWRKGCIRQLASALLRPRSNAAYMRGDLGIIPSPRHLYRENAM